MIKTKILIVEDEPIISACLQEDINASEEFVVIGAVESIAKAKTFQPSKYQILLLDLNLTDGHGTELLHFLNQHTERPKVLILSGLGDEQTVLNAVTQGADGYLLKDAAPAEIILSLKNLMAGESASSPSVTRILMDALRQQDSNSKKSRALATELSKALSPRELDVLNLLARGNSYQQMADQLGITYNTVSHYVKQLYVKLEVRSKNEAIYKAMSDGIIHL